MAFVGFGEFGRYVRDTIQDFASPSPQKVVYFDDNLAREGAPREGGRAFAFDAWSESEFEDHQFYIGLGYRHLQLKGQLVNKLLSLGRCVPHFVHPSSYVHPSVILGEGSFVYPGCSIDRNTVIGRATCIANADVIPHDCVIGDACWFGASVTLSGKVRVGEKTFIGSGTSVSNGVTIGSKALVGLGTCVTRNVEDGASVIGNPMRILNRPIKLT